jgi:cell division protein FtsW
MSRTKTNIQARKHNPDYSIILTVALLMLIGIVVLFSIGPALEISTGITVGKQFVSIALGLIAFAITFFVPLSFWHRVQKYLVGIAVLATTILLLAPGGVINPDIKGAKRWLVFGPVSFQPSELVKFALLIYLAAFLAHKSKHNKINDAHETLLPVAAITGVLGVVIVILERDLGTMLAIISIIVAMLYVAGVRLRHMGAFFGALGSVGALAILMAPHRVERLTTFLNPGSDLEGSGYHINQALIAVGSGGLFGLGLGKSVQAYGYLPEAGNDSIFAIYAEKFGFIGTILIIALFGYLLIKLAKIVQHAPNTYTRLIAAGVLAWIGSHTVINIGAILGILPLTGITLPFISYGGSSLIFIMAAVGLALNVSRYSLSDRVVKSERARAGNANNRHRRGNRRPRYAA